MAGKTAPPLTAAVIKALPSFVYRPKPRMLCAKIRLKMGPSRKKITIIRATAVSPEKFMVKADMTIAAVNQNIN